jgi:hypothetical protein
MDTTEDAAIVPHSAPRRLEASSRDEFMSKGCR